MTALVCSTSIGIADFLTRRGVVENGIAISHIREAGMWYRNEITDAHKCQRVDGEKYELVRMGFAKRLCSDDANLCEVIEINGGGKDNEQFEAVNKLLDENRFQTMYREQLELCAAEGTVAAYWRIEKGEKYTDGSVRGGRLRLNYVNGEGIIPITVVNHEVVEAAFIGTNVVDGKKVETCVLCTQNANGNYQYECVSYDEDGKLVDESKATLGKVKPFSVMKVASCNNILDMEGYGLPKLCQVIPTLLNLDHIFTVLSGDIDTSDKLVLINELLCDFDDNGKPIKPNESMKRRFVFLGEKLPQDGALVKEIVPSIRSSEIKDTVEFLLGILTMHFGYGTRKYNFEGGQIVTATQYVGERQDMLQELNRQRCEAKQYISELVHAALWFMNTYQNTKWDEDVDVLVEFDDSLIEDKNSKNAMLRADAVSGIGGKHVVSQYLMSQYNITEKEADEWAGDYTTGESKAELEKRLELVKMSAMSKAELRAWVTGESIEKSQQTIDTINQQAMQDALKQQAMMGGEKNGMQGKGQGN